MTNPTHRLSAAVSIAAVLGAAGPAFAQTAPAAIADCASISVDSERLACYDRAAGRAPAPRSPDAPPAADRPAAAAEKPAPAAGALRAPASLIDAAWGFEQGSDRYVIDMYNQNYLLFARWTDNVNTAPYAAVFAAAGKPETIDDTEAKFQLSFKMRLWTTEDRRWGVWAAYTQQNQWQVYNADISRPFRETNYMPELFVSYRPGIDLGGGFQWNLLNVGYNHQSNGRTDTLSRSWDRIIATFGFERENFALLAKAWYRVQHKEDNPEHHRLLRLRQPDRDLQVARPQLLADGPRQPEQGQGRRGAHVDVAAPPRTPARVRPGLHRLRREHDRLQLEPEHHRVRRRAQRRALAPVRYPTTPSPTPIRYTM